MVVDTNIIVSGVLSPGGTPAQILNAWRERRFLLVSSLAIIAEVQAVFRYPHIRKKYSLLDEEIDQITLLLKRDALLVPGSTVISEEVLSDPKDIIFLACALEGQAHLIVSGDYHLLDKLEFQGIPIVSARQFLEKIEPPPSNQL